MTAHRILAATAVFLSLALAAPQATAQPRRRDRTADRADRMDRVRQRIRAAREWKLTDALELDEAQAARVFPILESFDDKFLAHMREGRRLRRALRQELASEAPDDRAIARLTDDLLAHQRAVWELNEARFRAVRKVLTPAQAAVALVLLPEIDRFIRGEIGKAFKQRRGKRRRR